MLLNDERERGPRTTLRPGESTGAYPLLKRARATEGSLEPAKFDELHDAMPANLQPILYCLYFSCRTAAARKVDCTQVSFNGERVEILLRAQEEKKTASAAPANWLKRSERHR